MKEHIVYLRNKGVLNSCTELHILIKDISESLSFESQAQRVIH